MAQPMHCDYAGCGELAEMITSRIENGDTAAWCAPHYVLLCRGVVEAANQAELEATAQPESQGGQQSEPDDDEDDDEDRDVVRRLESLGAVQELPDSVVVAGQLPEPEPTTAAVLEAPRPTRVVKRGTSPSRKAHEARKRARAAPPPDEPDLSAAAAEGD